MVCQFAKCPLISHKTPKSCILRESREDNPTTTNLLHTSQIMRKIETQMCAAIHNNQNWSNANTTVHFNEEENVSVVRLHGNKIAEIDDNSMTIFDGGYQTTTTKSRLNALCTEFCVDGEGVFQKDFQWYVRLFVGAINGKNVYKNDTFTNGYTFA